MQFWRAQQTKTRNVFQLGDKRKKCHGRCMSALERLEGHHQRGNGMLESDLNAGEEL